MAGPLASVRRSTTAHAAVFAGLLALAASAGGVVADQAASSADSDWALSFAAKYALWDDPILDKLNLGLTIRQGVATLHGAVPSTEVARQAIARLKKVPGVRGVIDETYVPPADEAVTGSMPHPTTSQRPAVTNNGLPPAPGTPVSNPARPAPSPPPSAPLPPAREPPATILPPITTPLRAGTLAERIDQLRRGDRRFENIRFTETGGQVRLSGAVARPQDMWDFVELVQQLLGVTGVVLRPGS